MKGFCSTIMISLALTVAVTLTVGCGPNINPLEGPSTTKNPLKPSKNECITNEDCKSAFGGMCSVAECVKETSGNYCQYGILDCDDSNACTTDSCDIVTGCVNTAVPVDDSNACTLDACDPATGITHTAIDCDDGDDYTADSCDPATGCVHVQLECLTASDCDDSNACNGVETCVANTCVSGIALDCDDSDACTVDSCDPATGCVNTSLSQGCCTENEQCGSMGTSWGYSVPCLDDTECQPEVPVCLRGQCVPVGLDFGCTVDPIDSPEAYANGETGFCTTCWYDQTGNGWCLDNEVHCDDGWDDDADGLVDCQDSDCDTDIICQPCQPDCNGKECGDDGCGGSCGTCQEFFECGAGGICQSESEFCDDPTVVAEGACTNSTDMAAAMSINSNSDLTAIMAVINGFSDPCFDCFEDLITPIVLECGVVCQANPYSNECWECALPYYNSDLVACTGELACFPQVCQSQCDGKECGSDGCRGSCGTCSDGFSCNPEGMCEPVGPCDGVQCPIGQACEAGVCVNPNNQAVWCWDRTRSGEVYPTCHIRTTIQYTYWSPEVWKWSEYQDQPPACGSTPGAPVEYPEPRCCVGPDPLVLGWNCFGGVFDPYSL